MFSEQLYYGKVVGSMFSGMKVDCLENLVEAGMAGDVKVCGFLRICTTITFFYTNPFLYIH